MGECRKDGQMCSTCCELGVSGEYGEQQVLVVTGVVCGLTGRTVSEGKVVLK
jgi:hypothetical protein